MTKKQKILAAKKGPVMPTVTDQFEAIKLKFKRLAEVRQLIAKSKSLYQEQDELVTELLPLFIKKTDKQFIIEREVCLGSEIHKLIPYFYDEKKSSLVAKQWKSSAFETVNID